MPESKKTLETLEEWRNRCLWVHNAGELVSITCPEHGALELLPKNMMRAGARESLALKTHWFDHHA